MFNSLNKKGGVMRTNSQRQKRQNQINRQIVYNNYIRAATIQKQKLMQQKLMQQQQRSKQKQHQHEFTLLNQYYPNTKEILVNKIIYFTFEPGYLYAYKKAKKILEKLKSIYSGFQTCTCTLQMLNFGIYRNNFNELKSYLEKISSNNIFLFDGLFCPHLSECYKHGGLIVRNYIKKFLKNSNYIISFCEIFKNNNFQTIGNPSFNKEFSKIFFGNANINLFCNSNNIDLLYKNNISKNVIYFPESGFDNNINEMGDSNIIEKEIDVLIYCSFDPRWKHRAIFIEKAKKFCTEKNYTIKIFLRGNNDPVGLIGDELEKYLNKSKVVLHIPIFENLNTFPWAKCCMLFNSKRFVLIEDNSELEYIGKLNVATYNPNVEDDIYNKLDYYIKNENERNKHAIDCFEFMKNNYNFNSINFDNISLKTI